MVSVIAKEEKMSCCLYRHFDKHGKLLYVGISLSAIYRLAQHQNASHWSFEIATVKIEQFADRKEALSAERKAIVKENPRHNLMRPTVKEVHSAQARVEESKADLLRRLVQFNPMYSMQDAAMALQIGQTAIKRAIESGDIGYVELGGRKRITGWQLIEFIEAKSATRLPTHKKNAKDGEQQRPMAETAQRNGHNNQQLSRDKTVPYQSACPQ